ATVRERGQQSDRSLTVAAPNDARGPLLSMNICFGQRKGSLASPQRPQGPLLALRAGKGRRDPTAVCKPPEQREKPPPACYTRLGMRAKGSAAKGWNASCMHSSCR